MKYAILMLLGISTALLFPPAHAAPCPTPADGSMVKIPGHPFGIAVTNDGCWMFVSAKGGKQHGSLVVLHDIAGKYSVTRTIGLGSGGAGEALTHNGSFLVVTGWTGFDVFGTRKLEQTTGKALVGKLNTGRYSGAVYAITSRDDGLLFVSEERARKIAVYDFHKWRADHFRGKPLVGYVPVANAPVGLALSPNGKWLYSTSEVASLRAGLQKRCVSSYNGRRYPPGLLFRISIAKAATDPTKSVSDVMQAECSPVRVAVSPNGAYVWVAARGSGELLRIDTSSFDSRNASSHVEGFHVGGEPVGVAIRPGGSQIWVALSDRFAKNQKNNGRQLVGLIGIGDKSTTSVKMVTEPAYGFPRELHFMPDGRTLAVSLFRAKRIEFVTTPP